MEHVSTPKHSKYEEYIGEIEQTSGIYAITVNDYVVYVGQAQKIRRRVRNHMRYATKGYERAKYDLLSSAITAKDKDGKKVYQVKCVVLKECPIEELGNEETKILNKFYLPLNTILSPSSPAPKELKFDEFLGVLDKCEKFPEILDKIADLA